MALEDMPDLVGQPETVSIADVREVPLKQLSGDADARRLVERVMASTGEPSLVVVASFNSAI